MTNSNSDNNGIKSATRECADPYTATTTSEQKRK